MLLFQRQDVDGFAEIWGTFYSLLQITIQNYPQDAYLGANNIYMTLIVFIAFIVISTVMIINIFIAMINNTYFRNISNVRSQLAYAVSPPPPPSIPPSLILSPHLEIFNFRF